MNEANNEQNQVPKTSKLAIASIICIGVFCIIFHGMCCLPFPEWFFRLAIPGFLFTSPILGIAALIHIRLSKGRLRGRGLAITSIVISIILFLFNIGMTHLTRHLKRTVYISGLKEIGSAIKLYANEYEDRLPTTEKWCDLLVIQDNSNENRLSGHRETSDAMWGESAYALNKNIVDMKLSKIPNDVVLLFETTYGRTESERDTPREARDYFWKINDPNYKWNVLERKDLIYKERWNQVGGPEILTTEYYGGEKCLVLFADGHAELIKKEELDTLRWEP